MAMNGKTRALRVHDWCAPEDLTIEEIERPELHKGQVLVKVGGAALNFADILKIAGKHQMKPERPFILGSELSGVIEEVGPKADRFKAGQRVFATIGFGAFTEYAALHQDRLTPVPSSMPDEEAAVFPLAYQTSYIALQYRAAMRPGETVVIHSAAGGMGLAALQIAKALGAGKIIATVGSDEKLDLIREQGADIALNYEKEDFVAIVKDATGGLGADIFYDPVGGKITELNTKCIASEGRILIIGFTSGEFSNFRSNHLLVKNYSIIGLGVSRTRPEEKERCWNELLELYNQGKVKPLITARYPMDRIAEAMAFMSSRKSTGRIVMHW